MNLTLVLSVCLLAGSSVAGLLRRPLWAQGLGLVAGVLALEIALEKLYGVPSDRPNPVALPLALALLAATAAVFWWHRRHGLVRFAILDDELGRTTRYFLSIAIAAPILLELAGLFIEEIGQDLNLFPHRMGSTQQVLAHILLLGGVILFNSRKWDEFGRQREQLASALVVSEAKYRTIVEAANEGILALGPDLCLTLVNRPAARMFGYHQEEMIGRPLADFLDATHNVGLEKNIERRRAGKADRYEVQMARRDGSLVWLRVSAAPLFGQGGDFQGVVATISDVTDRKAHEEELEAKSREVEAANRHKSEFLANMSHELRTPLNSVLGFSEMLLDGRPGPLTSVQAEFMQNILASGRHLLDLINDLLDLNAIEAGRLEFRPETLDLREVVGEAASMLSPQADRKDITITSEVDPALGIVSADPVRLRQVVYNYLSNAIKFTPQGGAVWVRAIGAGQDRFRLEVEDNGIGVAEEDLPKLFSLFEQLDKGKAKRHQGAGLGLALTKRMVGLQGGRVGVSSQLGRGSTFWAELPRLAGIPESVAPGRKAGEVQGGTRS